MQALRRRPSWRRRCVFRGTQLLVACAWNRRRRWVGPVCVQTFSLPSNDQGLRREGAGLSGAFLASFDAQGQEEAEGLYVPLVRGTEEGDWEEDEEEEKEEAEPPSTCHCVAAALIVG